MKSWRAHRRDLLIAGVILALIGAAVWFGQKQPDTVTGVSTANNAYPFDTIVTLTFKEFQPSGNRFIGTILIEVYPQLSGRTPQEVQKAMDSLKKFTFNLYHYEIEKKAYVSRGGSDEVIQLTSPPARASLQGKGTFTWNGDPERGPFYYPFDRYILHLNTWLMEASDSGGFPNYAIQTLTTDFGNSNFIPKRRNLRAQSPEDLYEIEVQRPG